MTQYYHFTSYSGSVKERIKNLSLGPLTCITGPEASYKSSIGIGMRLALTGLYEPIGKLPSELIKLAADKTLGINATLQGPDGDAEWNLFVDPDTGKAQKPGSPKFSGKIDALTPDERYCIIPTDSLRDLLKNAKGDRKLREAMIRRFGGDLKSLPVPEVLDEASLEVWHAGVKTCRFKLDDTATADLLLASLSEHFRSEAGRLGKEKKPIESYVATKKQAIREAEILGGCSPEMLPTYEKRLAALVEAGKFAAKRQEFKDLKDDLVVRQSVLLALRLDRENKLTELRLDETRLETSEEALKFALENLQANLISCVEKHSVARYMADQYKAKIDAGDSKCLLCDNRGVNLERTMNFFVSKAELRATERSEIEQKIETTKKDLLHISSQLGVKRGELSQYDYVSMSKVRDAENTISGHEARILTLEEEISKAPQIIYNDTEADLRTKIDNIKASLNAKTELARKVAELSTLETKQGIYKKLEKEAIETQKILMRRIAVTASVEVSKGMLGGRSARFDSETCEWFVVRPDGQEYSWVTACGTEKTSLMLGLAAAWTRGSPLRVAIFDDEDMVGLSAKGITDFYSQCETLYSQGDFTQVVVISNMIDLAPKGGKWLTIVRDPLV